VDEEGLVIGVEQLAQLEVILLKGF